MWWWVLAACTGDVRRPPTDTDPVEDTADASDTADTEPPPAWDPTIDAVLSRDDGKVFFFRGGEYIRYDLAADAADAGYPRQTADWWAGVGDAPLSAAAPASSDQAWLFRGADVLTWDWPTDRVVATAPIATAFPGTFATVDAAAEVGGDLVLFSGGALARWRDGALVSGYPRAIDAEWAEAGADPVDAAFATSTRLYLFRGDAYLRVDLDTGDVLSVYPRRRTFWWPGLWDEHEGHGDPTEVLPAAVSDALYLRPSDAEIAARRARVATSAAADGYTDLTAQYPLFVASVEDRLGSWGCGLLRGSDGVTHRFRCATDTQGPHGLDATVTVGWVDWSRGAYHVEQVSQGDFMAGVGTPLSIFGTDDGTYRIVSVTGNAPTGSINAGLNVRVSYVKDGVTHQIGFSHLNTTLPQSTLDALANDTPLPCGTAFGFIGTTGNLWIAAPPPTDAPYTGDGSGLPVPHSHLWFVGETSNHMTLTVGTREAIDFSGSYPYGGG